jgi:hypothetical protein
VKKMKFINLAQKTQGEGGEIARKRKNREAGFSCTNATKFNSQEIIVHKCNQS